MNNDREIAIVLKAVTTLTRVNTRSYQHDRGQPSWSIPFPWKEDVSALKEYSPTFQDEILPLS